MWQIKPVLELCEIPKYEEDYRVRMPVSKNTISFKYNLNQYFEEIDK